MDNKIIIAFIVGVALTTVFFVAINSITNETQPEGTINERESLNQVKIKSKVEPEKICYLSLEHNPKIKSGVQAPFEIKGKECDRLRKECEVKLGCRDSGLINFTKPGYIIEIELSYILDDLNLSEEWPKRPKTFTPELEIAFKEPKNADESHFRNGITLLLFWMNVTSDEWIEKTMFAGEMINPLSPDDEVGAKVTASSGIIYFNSSLAKEISSGFGPPWNRDMDSTAETILHSATIVHEVQHIIDSNNYDKFEGELRAKIAADVYLMEAAETHRILHPEIRNRLLETVPKNLPSYCNNRIENRLYWKWKNRGIKNVTTDEGIKNKYLDHNQCLLKTDFIDKSWYEFLLREK